MKAWDIIEHIRKSSDAMSIRMLEDIFITAYLNGIYKGMDDAIKLSRQEILASDVEEAKKAFIERYL